MFVTCSELCGNTGFRTVFNKNPLRYTVSLFHPVGVSAKVLYQPTNSNLLFLTKVVAYRRSKTTENTKRSASKVVAVAYERWSLTRGFTNSNLTEEPIGNFDSGHLRGVVTYGGWSLTGGGRLREVVAQGGSTVLY